MEKEIALKSKTVQRGRALWKEHRTLSATFFGKYRGVVTENNDPLGIGRIRAQVPDVFGTKASGWALPCVPSNISGKAGSALPKIGAAVWMEFERGDPDHPIWTGCYYSHAAATPPSLRK